MDHEIANETLDKQGTKTQTEMGIFFFSNKFVVWDTGGRN